MFPFDPPENIRKPLVFGCFQGDQKGTLGRKGLNLGRGSTGFVAKYSGKCLMFQKIGVQLSE